MFRVKQHVVIIGNNEDTAIGHLAHIRNEISENPDLKDVFEINGFDKEGATELIVRFNDGYRFRVIAKGAKQKVRGINWMNKRPDLVVIDDLEDDEAVMNKERRDSLRDWVLTAVLPGLSRISGQIRFVGTILHEDSMLMTTINSRAWVSKLYKAHKSYDNFSEMLWPDLWSESALREIRQVFIDTGNPEGYSQEYLNDPSDLQNPYFRDEDFIPMDEAEHRVPKTYYVGVDFALSDKTYSDFTVMCVGGYDNDGLLHIVDERSLRTADTKVIVDELFSIIGRWKPDTLILEGGIIEKAILPILQLEMRKRNKWVGIKTYTPVLDKTMRANAIQQRMRSGGVRWDFDAPWFEEHRHELRTFPRGKKKDKVDAIAWLGRGIDELVEAPSQADLNEEAYWQVYEDTFSDGHQDEITGY